MSIYIKGMEMPQFFDRLFVGRSFDGGIYIRNEREDENSESVTWYPVIEILPHGRLIDADELAGCLATLLQFPSNLINGQWIVNTIREQPTIIPADKEGKT